jgi:uncharacterized protein YndB with AHSA1/START domain
METTASVTVSRGIEEVFAYITDVTNMPQWVSGARSARLLSPEMQEGARYVVGYHGGWRTADVEVLVTEWSPPRLFGSTTVRGPFAFEGVMRLEAVEGGTRVTNTIEAGPDSVASRLATFVLGWALRGARTRRVQNELEDLAGRIEGEPRLVGG